MFSKISWAALIATGVVGSGAGIAFAPPRDAPLPVEAAWLGASGGVLPDGADTLQPAVDNHEFAKRYALAQVAARHPFAVLTTVHPKR